MSVGRQLSLQANTDFLPDLRMGLENLRAHKLRSLLTMLGMIFGVAAVVAMLSIGAGAQQEVMAFIEQLGVRNLIVEAREAPDQQALQKIRKISAGLSFQDFRVIQANVEAMTSGQPLPYVTAYGFFTTFVNVGGTGATLALALVLWNSKAPGFRQVSRVSLPTQIFGINEPIFFGLPIMLNPLFMIPYVLNALILTTGTYLLMHWNVIHKPFVNIPWTTPPIVAHYLVSGGDWKAAVWGAVSIVMAAVVYLPFARAAERQELKAESHVTS